MEVKVKTFQKILSVGWLLLALFVICSFAFPKQVSRLVHPMVSYIQIFPLCLLVLSFIYGAMRFLKK